MAPRSAFYGRIKPENLKDDPLVFAEGVEWVVVPPEPLSTHYLSPKCQAAENHQKGNFGVFAVERIDPGELLTVWGGIVVPLERLSGLEGYQQSQAVQVEQSLYLAPFAPSEPADYFNHSCSPNAGLSGQIALVALRTIEPGEEICFDYAMSDSTSYDEFTCGCGSAECRGQITGEDWKLPDLRRRYAGYFSPYLQIKITHPVSGRKLPDP